MIDDRARYSVQKVIFIIWIDAASFKQTSSQAMDGGNTFSPHTI
jgi:hypothetical protein